MGVIEDVRSVIQDLVAPELKSLSVKLDSAESESKLRDKSLAAMIESAERESKLRDESLAAKIDSAEREARVRDELTHVKLEALSARMDGQYASIMNALNLDRRIEVLERDKHTASA